MTKSELIILRQLNEIDDLKKRNKELETVLIETKAIMLNVTELKIEDYKFIMDEIERVIKDV